MFGYCGNNPVSHLDPSGYRFNGICTIAVDGGDDAYIYNQNNEPYADISLGLASVSHGGCGPVAVYNAMQILGHHDIAFTDVVDYYKDNGDLILGGLLGSSYSACIDYFEEQQYTVYATTDVHIYAEMAATADACILFFSRNSASISPVSAHYVAFRQIGSTSIYYNPFSDVYGPYYYSGDCYDFLEYVGGCLPLLILIYE